MKAEEKGATLMEVFGVLAILAVLAASVWGIVNSAWSRYRLSATLSQLQTLQKGITRMYASAGKYDDLAETNAIKKLLDNNVPPADMKVDDNNLRHAMGGSVTIAPVTNNTSLGYGRACDSFTVTFDKLNKKGCLELASYSWVGNDSANIVSVSVNGQKYIWPTASESLTDKFLPISTSDALTLCEDEPIGDGGRYITWEFR